MPKSIYFITYILSFALTTWAQNLNPSSDAEVALDQVKAAIEDPNSPLSTLGKKAEETTNSKGFKSKIEKELSKYKIKFTVDPFGKIIDTDNVTGGVYYQYIVEPAFRNNEQLRKDIWVINLNSGYKGASAGGQIRLTFSRFYSGKNAKRKAAFAPVQGFWKTPFNSNDIKTKLNNGDGFRFEVSGDIAIGVSDSLSDSNLKSGAYSRYKRGGLFIMDVYKINDKQARARFIGLKNRGELELGVNAKNRNILSSLPGKLKELLTIGFGGSIRASFNFFEKPMTLDTMMVDYLFNFSSDKPIDKDTLGEKTTAESALNEIFRNLRRGGFASLFLFFDNNKNLSSELMKNAETAEKLAKEDLEKYKNGEIKFPEVRVYNYFRGQLLSFIKIGEIYGRVSSLVGGKSQGGSVLSHVTSYDENQQAHYYWLDNGFTQHSSRSLFGRNKYNMLHDLDVLIYSDKDMSVGNLTDVVVRTQIENTEFSKDETDALRKRILGALPIQHQNDPKVKGLLKRASHTNAYISFTHSFGYKAFRSAGEVDKGTIALKLYDFFDQHPEKQFMHLPDYTHSEASNDNFGHWVERKTYEIADVLRIDATNEERMKAFSAAKRDPLFERYIIQEFFPSLLPQTDIDSFFGFDLKFSSAEAGTHRVQLGENRVSSVYAAVSFMRSIINDHSLDLQMTSSTDHSGSVIPVPINQDNFTSPMIQ